LDPNVISAIRRADRDPAAVLIVATALGHPMVLATRNTRDFADIPGLALDDPWS
jgi:predicted nucleic acid-binding protein